MRLNFAIIILSLVTFAALSQALCPPAEKLKPCTCDEKNKTITCQRIPKSTELGNIFGNISSSITTKELIFNEFRFLHNPVTHFGPRWFGKLRFRKLFIDGCHSLTTLEHGSFIENNKYLKELVIHDTPIVQKDNDAGEDVFGSLMLVTQVVKMDISGFQLTSIPERAFSSILANHGELQMRQMIFCVKGQKCRSIESIGPKAFFYLVHVEKIDLHGHKINRIDNHAFVLKNTVVPPKKDSKITIDLSDNNLNDESFGKEAFKYLHPMVKVDILMANNKNLTVLDETVFRTFLGTNRNNTLTVTGCPIKKDSPKMKWINLKNFKNQIKF